MKKHAISIKHEQVGVSAVKSILSTVPIIGTALTETMVDYWGRVKQERINKFTEKLKQYFENISDEEIDEEFIRSEDFAQFFELILKKVSESKSENKLEVFKNILIGNIKSRQTSDFSETFLNLVSQLVEKQMIILKIVSEIEFDEKQNNESITELKHRIQELEGEQRTERSLYNDGFANNYNKITSELKWALDKKRKSEEYIKQISKERYNAYYKLHGELEEMYIQDLMAKGLLDLVQSGYIAMPLPFLKLTGFGKKFLEFIKQN